ELVPGPFPAFRTWVKACRFEDVLHCVLRDGADAQLLEFPQDSGVSPVVFPGELQDQPPDLLDGSAAATPDWWFPPPLSCLADPPAKCVGMHDRHQLVEGPSQACPEFEQPPALLGSDRDLFGQLTAEDFILDLQISDLPGQLFLGRPGQ